MELTSSARERLLHQEESPPSDSALLGDGSSSAESHGNGVRRSGCSVKDGVPSLASRGVAATVAASATERDLEVVGSTRDSAGWGGIHLV